MAQGIYTPLQLTVISGMLANQGLKSLPVALTTALAAFNATALITNFSAAVTYYTSRSWATASTLLALQSIGSTTCPALGNSIPAAYTNLDPVLNPSGFSGLISQMGNSYLGNGDYSKFTQGFSAIQAYVNTTNQLINSSVNAQTYLGPTFRNMDALTTNNISAVNTNFTGFGVDLANQGQLTNLSKINIYGTPAALLQQIAAVAHIQGGTLKAVETQLLSAGLTKANVRTLINRGTVVTDNEFDQYQRLAYNGMTKVVGADLQTVLDLLDVTTPNITTMADLLNQQKIFPNSFTTMKTPSASGPIPIYLDDGSVNINIEPTVNAFLPSATGCEDLGKIIPPGLAVANKAVQTSLQQITGVVNTTLPKLSRAILGTTTNSWNINRAYLANAVVSNGSPIPSFYRAQQDVPAGTGLNNTDYWLPTTLGGLNTMANLPLIQAQTKPLAPAVSTYYENSVATGSGPNGTITIYDVLGLALDSTNVAAQLDIATQNIISLTNAGVLGALNAIYVNMASAANDAVMLSLITQANAAVASVVSSRPTNTATLNTSFNNIGTVLNSERGYQIAAGINYFDLQAKVRTSILSFAQNLPQYGLQTAAGMSAEFLTNIADTDTLTGQAIVGTMREGQNNQRLNASQIGLDTTPSTSYPVTPVPVITPVY